MNTPRKLPRPRSISRRGLCSARWAALLLGALQALDAQSVFQETFTGTSAYGWNFGGTGYTPILTANGGGDTDGNGWLRLTSNAGNLSTYALLDTQIFSVGAQIQITMDYAFYNGSGADGITFFLVDGTTNIGTFTAGAYGGSLGYAQKDQAATGIPGGVAGMDGGYLGFGFDNFGNYSNPTEGRVGGTGSVPNAIAVRGPESSDWAFINGSGPLQNLSGGGQMDFPSYTNRPVQTGADYRSFRLTLDANNLLVVEMKFGASSDYIVVFTSNLAGYVRPETFKVGFTGATGGSTEIHEIRNLSVVTTPGATIGGSFEWDDGLNSSVDNWGSGNPTNETNNNWFSLDGNNNNKTPFIDSDIFFGSRPANTSAAAAARPSPYASVQNVNLDNDVRVKSLNFNSKYDYVLGSTTGKTITLGNTSVAGTPSIAVNDSIANPRFHTINNNLIVNENLVVANQSHSTLTLNGTMNLGANTLSTVGAGQTNFNGAITGSGPIIATGASPNGRDSTGIVTLNADNSSSYTGTITINGGQVVALQNGALGNTAAGTTVNAGGTLTFRGGITTAEPLTLKGEGTALSEIWNAGAIYNDGGVNNLTGAVTLGDNATIRSRAGNLTISGAIGGAYNLTKTGDGILTLNADNTYTGETRILGGALRVGDANRVNGSDIVLNGGVLELTGDLDTANAAHFTRAIGATAGDDVRWTGDGGFSASGIDATVTLVSGGSTPSPDTLGGQVRWNTDGFVGAGSALLLSSAHADKTLTLTNAIDLNGAQREVRVANGTALVDGVLSGVLGNSTGTGGLLKTGDGTLQLSGANTYTGATVIQGGALRGTIPGASNIQLNGGVLELGANYTSALGASGGQIQWTGGGGLAALSGTQTFNVNNNGETTTLTWASGGFVANNQALVLGSASSAGTLVMANSIALGGAARTIRMQNGSADIDAQLNGNLTGSSGSSLRVEGSGTLAFNRNDADFDRALTVDGAEFRMTGSADLNSMTSLTVQGGGVFKVQNGTSNDNTRLGDSLPISLNAGTFNYLGRTDANSTETVGTLTLSAGANTVNAANGANNRETQLTLGGLGRSAGATVDFTNLRADGTTLGGTLGGTGNNSRILVTGLANTNGILGGWATVGDNWATEISDTQGIGALGTYQTSTDHNAWAATENVSVSTAISMGGTGNETVNSLRFTGASGSVAVNDRAHRIDSGGILVANGAAATINADNGTGSLYAVTSSELVVHTQGTGTLNIQGRITNDGTTAKGLTKSGDGTLTLSGSNSNTYTGVTTVNSGTLSLNKSGGATAIAGNGVNTSVDLLIGDGAGIDTVKILANEQIADNATVSLNGGTLLNNNNQAVLDIGNSLETFANLNVSGNSVIDFSGGSPSAPSFLVISTLAIVDTGSLLTIRNWIDAADYFLIAKAGLTAGAQADITNRIIFDGYGTATWEDYSSDYFMITPHAAPVPEPAAFGLLSLGGLVTFAAARRRRRQ